MAKRKPLVFIAGELVENKASDVLDVNNGVVTAAGSTEERSLKERFGDILNVKDFGAKGNGITDDTVAFQNAKAAADQRNAVVYVPDGQYKLTEPIVGEFITFGHPTFTGNGSITFVTDLYNDYVHKTKNVNETVTGDKTFTGHTTFNGPTTNTGTESHSGAETHTGAETHKGTETHQGNETHGKESGTTLTYHGKEVHDGLEQHLGNEEHSGSEEHTGPETHTGLETHEGAETHKGSETHGKASGTTLTYNGTEVHNGPETHNGTETHKGTETHEGSETHGKASGTTLTYNGTEVHNGPEDHKGAETHSGTESHSGNETHSGTETHTGTETHNGPVTIKNLIVDGPLDLSRLTAAQLKALLASLLAAETNGFADLDSTNGKLKVDVNELIVGDGTDGLVVTNGKIKLKPSELAGKGLTGLNNLGTLNVDFQQMTADELKALLAPLIADDGGLYWNEDGQLVVKLERMSLDEFIGLLDVLQLPYYVGARYGDETIPTEYHVNPHVSGYMTTININDYPDIDFGTDFITGNVYKAPNAADKETYFVVKNNKIVKKRYGWDPEHPWKTVAYAAELLAAKYNISKNTVYVRVHCTDGYEFTSSVKCNQQTRTSGEIIFLPATINDKPTIHVSGTAGDIISHTGGKWGFYNFNFINTILPQTNGATRFPSFVTSTSSTLIHFYNCNWEFIDKTLKTGTAIPTSNPEVTYSAGSVILRCIYPSTAGQVRISGVNASVLNKPRRTVSDAPNPRFSKLTKNSIIKAGSTFNGQKVTSDLTLTNDLTIYRETILVENSVIKPNSILIIGSKVNGTTISTVADQTVDSEITISSGAANVGTIKSIDLDPFDPDTETDSNDYVVNYASTFKGYLRRCRFAAGSVIKVGSEFNGDTITGTDLTLNAETVVYSFDLKSGSVIAAGSFLVPSSFDYGPIINTKSVSKESDNIPIGEVEEDITISSTTTFVGSDALSATWFYLDLGGQCVLTTSGENTAGTDYLNYGYYVEGSFNYFMDLIQNTQINYHGTGLKPLFLYDYNKVRGIPYRVRQGASLILPATDPIDRDTYLPGRKTTIGQQPSGTYVSTKTGAWISPAND